jgi:hypothetical protein
VISTVQADSSFRVARGGVAVALARFAKAKVKTLRRSSESWRAVFT